ncbi:MAG TPA: VanZ family protein [Candidatus Limnocylindrales bacterium]|nr:VanZ family protein [Candidatus Limnocylindrales bacterium]
MSTIEAPSPWLRRNLFAVWLPTLLWLLVLTGFSTDTFSAEHTGSILWKIIHALYGGMSEQAFEKLHFLVRKSAHFLSYGFLSALAFFSWRATLPDPRQWTLRWSILACLVTLGGGSLDEFHQRFVPSRTSDVRDVLLDTVGAICFQMAIAFFIRRKERRNGLTSQT